jgi:hypothetical protein
MGTVGAHVCTRSCTEDEECPGRMGCEMFPVTGGSMLCGYPDWFGLGFGCETPGGCSTDTAYDHCNLQGQCTRKCDTDDDCPDLTECGGEGEKVCIVDN